MILSNPPRIVLDIMRSESSRAGAAASRPTAVAKPTPVPAPKAPAAARPVPATPKPVTKSPEPAKPVPVAKAPAPPAPKPAARPSEPAKPETVAKASPSGAKPGSDEPLPEWSGVPKPKPAPAITPSPRAGSEPDAAGDTAQAYAEPTFLDRLSGGAWKVALAAGALALGGLAVMMRRRHRPLPNDLDVTAIAEEIEGSDSAPASGLVAQEAETAVSFETPATAPQPPAPASASSDDSSFEGLFDDVVVPEEREAGTTTSQPTQPIDLPAQPDPVATQPVPIDPPTQPSPVGAATQPNPIAAAGEPPRPEPGEALSLFEDAGGIVGEDSTEGEAAMDRDMDLPMEPSAERATSPSPSPAPTMGGSAAPSGDTARVLQELERRMQTLESKLEESNEAREKLERQVAAQSEELRVQRAAIARTQRALRTMSRGEDEKATEPALRDGDSEAKTQING